MIRRDAGARESQLDAYASITSRRGVEEYASTGGGRKGSGGVRAYRDRAAVCVLRDAALAAMRN